MFVAGAGAANETSLVTVENRSGQLAKIAVPGGKPARIQAGIDSRRVDIEVTHANGGRGLGLQHVGGVEHALQVALARQLDKPPVGSGKLPHLVNRAGFKRLHRLARNAVGGRSHKQHDSADQRALELKSSMTMTSPGIRGTVYLITAI